MNLLAELYWREPLWLALTLLPLIVVALHYRGLSIRRQRLVAAELLPWALSKPKTNKLLISQLLSCTAWLLLVIALSGPRTPAYVPPEHAPPAAEVILISDLSGSMEATERLLNGTELRRRDAATPVMQRWNNQTSGNLNIGLMIVAGHPHWLLKPSTDPYLRNHLFNQLKTVQAPTLGNNLADALKVAGQTNTRADISRGVVLFTDGDIEESQRQRTESTLAQLMTVSESLRVTLVGVGSDELSRLNDGETTRLESKWLKQLAEHNRVNYLSLQQAIDADLVELLQIPSPRIAAPAQHQVLWDEWFALPLICALLLLVLVFNLRRRHA